MNDVIPSIIKQMSRNNLYFWIAEPIFEVFLDATLPQRIHRNQHLQADVDTFDISIIGFLEFPVSFLK